MSDSELLKGIQEAVVGINLTADRLAGAELALLEMRISIQVLMALQRRQMIESGKTKEVVDSVIDQAEKVLRSEIRSQLERAAKSAPQTERGDGEPDVSGLN